jgi:hypothetical protein
MSACPPLDPREWSPRPLCEAQQAAVLEDLARRISQLAPSHRDPEQFHLDELEATLPSRLTPSKPEPNWPL